MQIELIGCGRWGRNIPRDLITGVARAGGSANGPWLNGLTSMGLWSPRPHRPPAEVIEQWINRGVPVFVEKPLTNDLAVARRIVDSAGDRVFVMDKWRYHPGIEELRHTADSGELGNVLGLRLTHETSCEPLCMILQPQS